MCQILHVSVSGYYKYRRNLGKPGKDAILSAAMQEILDESPYNDNYGAPRMQLALLQKRIKAGIRSITRIMREKGWLPQTQRSYSCYNRNPGTGKSNQTGVLSYTAIEEASDRYFSDSMSRRKAVYFSNT